jgi:hypothetical protein
MARRASAPDNGGIRRSCIRFATSHGQAKGKMQDIQSVLLFKLDKDVMNEVTEFQFDHPAVAQFWS